MDKGTEIELEKTDLGTLLGNLASRIRNDGLSLMGRAFTNSKPGDQDFKDLDRLCSSLEGTATLLEAIKGRLCSACQMIDIAKHVTFGRASDSRRGLLRSKRKNRSTTSDL